MKSLLIIIGALLVFTGATAQVKDSFELRTLPTYDMSGNVYMVVKRYDHIPTRQDSITFQKQSDLELKRMMKLVQVGEQRRKYKKPNTK